MTRLKRFLRSTTGRLALSYLAIIMLMSIGFSVVFYQASYRELGRQAPPPNSFQIRQFDEFRNPNSPGLREFFEQRIQEGRERLLIRLIVLNVVALGAGAALSYYLARRTLQPIEDNMEAQAQFVSDASHELRTPLTALQAINEVALRRSKISTTEAKDILQNNVEEVGKLQALTDALLKLAKQDDLERQPVSLQAAVGNAMNTVVTAAVDKDIAVEDKVPNVQVLADVVGLTQVITILLDNAIKYSPAKTTVRVTGGLDGKYGFVTVTDKGQGIGREDLQHVFDRFCRADQSRNKQKVAGYGIGLALAKKIIDQHGGEIVATSAKGKGSTFTVKIPLV